MGRRRLPLLSWIGILVLVLASAPASALSPFAAPTKPGGAPGWNFMSGPPPASTREVALPAPSAPRAKGGVKLEDLVVRKEDLPPHLVLSPNPRLTRNPALVTDASELKKIGRDAFASEIYFRYWKGAHVLFLAENQDEEIGYHVIAVEFAKTAEVQFESEMAALRSYMDRVAGDEFELIEAKPFAIVIASDTPGNEPSRVTRELRRLMARLALPSEDSRGAGGTGEVSLGTREVSLEGREPANGTGETGLPRRGSPIPDEARRPIIGPDGKIVPGTSEVLAPIPKLLDIPAPSRPRKRVF